MLVPNSVQTWKAMYPPQVAKPIPIDIIGGNSFGRYPRQASNQTWNMMVSMDSLVPTPGYSAVTTIAKNGKGRAAYNSVIFNHIIAVIDDGVYVIDPSLSSARVGSLNTSEGPVYIADNLASQIAISDGLNIYIFDYKNNTFNTVTVDFLPGTICYQDTYFISVDLRTNQFRLSLQSDGTQWPPAAQFVGEIESKATTAMAAQSVGGDLYVFGKTVSEPWTDVGLNGSIPFPYQWNRFNTIDYGVLNPLTIAINGGRNEQNIMCWIGSNERSGSAIMALIDRQPVMISDEGINYVLSHLTAPNDVFAMMYRIDGHLFYHVTFYTDNITYVYDFNTKLFFNLSDENRNYHIARSVVFFNNDYYFVSNNDGFLYKMSSDFYTYNGKEIPRMRICSSISLGSCQRFRLNNITVECEQGNVNGVQRIDLSMSLDGGQSFGNIYSKYLHPLGKRQGLVQWYPNVSGNDITPQFRFFSLGRFVITNAIGSVII